ncbi:hypothetical protein Hanom_Chr17g01542411 [Helianthus anomalus]
MPQCIGPIDKTKKPTKEIDFLRWSSPQYYDGVLFRSFQNLLDDNDNQNCIRLIKRWYIMHNYTYIRYGSNQYCTPKNY